MVHYYHFQNRIFLFQREFCPSCILGEAAGRGSWNGAWLLFVMSDLPIPVWAQPFSLHSVWSGWKKKQECAMLSIVSVESLCVMAASFMTTDKMHLETLPLCDARDWNRQVKNLRPVSSTQETKKSWSEILHYIFPARRKEIKSWLCLCPAHEKEEKIRIFPVSSSRASISHACAWLERKYEVCLCLALEQVWGMRVSSSRGGMRYACA